MFAFSHIVGNVISERVTNTNGTSTNFTGSFAATSGQRSFVTVVAIKDTSGTGGYVDFRDGSGGAILFTVPFGADGVVMGNGSAPLFATSSGTALAYDVSEGLTTVIISVTGVKQGG